MKTIKYILMVLVIAITVTSCEKPDNINPKAATSVPVGTLFSNAEVSLVNQINSMSVNYNTTRLLVQYWQETTYFSEARYDFSSRNIPDNYSTALYRNVIMDLKEAKTILNASEFTGGLATQRDNQVAIADILQVYAYQVAVDAFGDMPYTEALQGIADPSPAYDDAASIYTDLLARLTADIATLDASQGSYGSADFIYGGDVAKWKKFAASLKLRAGMRLADVNPTAAQAAVESAYSAGVFANEDESGILYYSGVSPHVNTIYSGFFVDGRKDYIPTNTLIDYMKSLDDPRLPLYFDMVDGDYIGAEAGADAAATYTNYSHFADRFFQPDFEAILIDYVETEFLLAEAAQRGWNVGGAAEDYFNNAVTQSILYWEGTQADADAYLAAHPYDAANWKESLGMQKWLALYNRSVEAWAEWRRLDYPVLNVPTGMVYGDIPSRMPYPFNEVKNNESNYNAASAAIGGDDMRTNLFWDIYDPF
ncbi:MAG: SusD/RagB family nutrient-binding outer membrane lipoprotein [Bacteroidales bacterium]|nr:SusD/RagB family nutrient-binding outer membrane lipoprotein [Bacteroidales bacterium]